MNQAKQTVPPTKQKYIETPEKMSEYFEEYRKDIKADPFKTKDWVGASAKEVTREKEKPLTMEGFEGWLSEHGIITDVSDYFENKGDRYEAYVPICRAIKIKIRQDQIEGGMAGIYSSSITQRLCGLTDKQETRLTAEQPLFYD